MRRLRTVLVVDDELDVREIVGEVLADAGYDVRLAADGRQGLAEVSGAPRPLVLLLDLVMPVMTGSELFTKLRSEASTADIPVVIMTSDPAAAPKGVPVLAKPVGISTLLDAVGGAFASDGASAEE